MKFPLKSQRHLTLVWATSCVSHQPPSTFLLNTLQFQTPCSLLCSHCLWCATKRHTAVPLTASSHFSFSPLSFTRWQSSMQCLSAAGIASKGRAPMWSMCMALMLSPVRAFKALCVFHMSQTSLTTLPCLGCNCWTPTTLSYNVGTRTEVDRV